MKGLFRSIITPILGPVKDNIFAPIVRRIGTSTAVLFNSVGTPADDAQAVGQAVVTIGLVGLDLATSYWYRKGR